MQPFRRKLNLVPIKENKMSFNLIETAKNFLTNELVSKSQSYFGDSEKGVTRAISGIIPSIVSGLADKASTQDGAYSVIQLAQDYHQSGILNNIENFLGNRNNSFLNERKNLADDLFGSDKTEQLSAIVADFSGVKISTASSLSNITLSTILAFLGRHAANSSMGTSSIITALNHHANAGFPAGFSLGNLFNTSDKPIHYSKNISHPNETYTAKPYDNPGNALRWLLPLLLLAIAAVLAWYFFKAT
jgi:hypothetical protein